MNREEETIICFCEDVTEEEIVRAIEEGYTSPKEIKQHLRAGMGECQGRGCMPLIMRLISQKTGKPRELILPPSVRPPIVPVPIGLLGKIVKRGEKEE
ncbi:MAG: (2Fe-2S)-binding protein [Chloroflexi bacterium]|nr:(2Fe-2S)-binding protein [Deltaproteobacteria bacterium]RLC62069.1 MAG: (2Fe-2S)-binding protein [Chloroflexota bacterium]